jgi:anti-sigma B factor antagonist
LTEAEKRTVPARRPRYRWFEIDQEGGVTLVTFTPQDLVQADDIEEVGRQLINLVENFSTSRLVLDLRHVTRLSSLLLGKLIALNHRVQAAGGRLALCNVNQKVHDVFRSVNLLQSFPIYASEMDARRSL